MTIEMTIKSAPAGWAEDVPTDLDYFDLVMDMDRDGLSTEKWIYYFSARTSGVFRQYAHQLLKQIKRRKLLPVLKGHIPKPSKHGVPLLIEVERGGKHGYVLTARVPIHQLGFKGLAYQVVADGTSKIKTDLDIAGAKNVVESIVDATQLDLEYYSVHQDELVKLKNLEKARVI